jgi:hypothetical protein
MKKLCIAIALAGALAAPALQAAMTIKPLSDNSTTTGYTGGNNGGEFRASAVSADLLAATVNLQGYASTTAGANWFQTFCIERTETFSPNTTYEVQLNNNAIYNNTSGGSDPISMGTAWLYSQFAKGTLNNYDYTYGTGRIGSATTLQLALWWLEGEANTGDQSANIFITAIPDAAWRGFNSTVAANGAFGVKAMNLFDVGKLNNYDFRHQDMLVVVPEPTTVLAGALLLLPFAASTIRFIRKNRTA